MKRKVVLLTVILILACTWSPALSETKNEVQAEYLGGRPDRPLSEAVRLGNLLILSGKLGIDPATGKLAPGGITAETRQTLENIRQTLEKYGSSMDRVLKCTVMLTDINEWAEMNKVYAEYFIQNKPARSAFGVSGLVLGARVEIECWALID